MLEQHVVELHALDETWIPLTGAKAARLGALARIDGVRVPEGVCVTTGAYRHALAHTPRADALLRDLARLGPDDHDAVRAVTAELRAALAEAPLPDGLAKALTEALAPHGEDAAWAVRSSATAEDLPSASFAGQLDSRLGVVGADEVLRQVRQCWASLFTERAVAYRRRQGVDDRAALMGVIVQRMVPAEVSGVLFTADPVSGLRTTSVIEAVPGLGEDLVAGRAEPELTRVRDGAVVDRTPPGGRDPRDPSLPLLPDARAVRLAALGRRIEAEFGAPQDIEWCWADGTFHVVQSRPVTTLFPVPDAPDDAPRVYVSVGHQQMMTDAMRPLGRSLWRLTAMTPMTEAGGRLFVDVTARLAAPAGRAALLEVMGRGDPLVRDALETVLAREDFLPPLPEPAGQAPSAGQAPAAAPGYPEPDEGTVDRLVERCRAGLAALEQGIRGRTGADLFAYLREAFAEHRRELTDPESMGVLMAGMQAGQWLRDRLGEWLGEPEAADTLTLSLPGNVTARMGLDLLDVADVIRPHPEVVAHLERAGDADLLPGLSALDGGPEARAALEHWLERYGMRCAGEIDVTRPRWRENPTALVPLLLDHVRHARPGEARRRFEDGLRRAREKRDDVLARLRESPDGEARAAETARMIDRVRAFGGYREYPKYQIVSRYFVYRRALWEEAGRLVRAGVLADPDDIAYLTFEELEETARTGHADPDLLRRRKDEHRVFEQLAPPRVLTSDGQALHGTYRRDDVPEGALAGVPVSAGTVEGRARVVHDMTGAELEPGDILVTRFTDPSWTPLFVAAGGLVTEVGGQMTHGAVIAREYGLPAVVGVTGATERIPDGVRVRVHGAEGWVEILA